MKLCYDDVKKWNICIPMLLHFRRNYSEPTELIEIINDEYLSAKDLRYGFERLCMSLSKEEHEAYCKRLGIDEVSMPYTYNSDNVSNSIVVAHSSHILGSECVYSSEEVENSKHIFNSKIVKDSTDIYNSKYITNSSMVNKALNISSCNNVYSSNYIMGSHGVAESSWVNESYNILDSSRVVNSAFCRNVTNVENCYFCYDLHNQKDFIFNQPASEWVRKFMVEQLNHYLKYELDLMKVVRTDMYPVDPVMVPPTEWFAQYPNTFISWLRTTPLFDEAIMLAITFDKRFNS